MNDMHIGTEVIGLFQSGISIIINAYLIHLTYILAVRVLINLFGPRSKFHSDEPTSPESLCNDVRYFLCLVLYPSCHPMFVYI